ncbi:hypothetical protein [Paraglaciecola psychrophila]|uniref:TonB-dependent receptor n=1 Tax=Paraglaciecola psychrophila 170 TaxID=1129794 RepID=K6ZR86_9ALTE|nr:hypothetical protein [Paraglaciecola psychrophila]AGH43438.1 TonB-dependent receptor [Paraglaciecola psychrophila 170]GAC38461.1 hypothetical protein GPSY_2850 [Paraglaciecola psychrophila 170]
MENVGDAYSTFCKLNTGKKRENRFELALNGNLTEKLSVQVSAVSTWMH